MTVGQALTAALDAEAEGLAAVERRTDGDGIEWAAGGVAFAAVTGETGEFRLSPVVAGAARGTPDAGPSHRGGDWVSFSPPLLDRYARDRAVAWFGSAYRGAARR